MVWIVDWVFHSAREEAGMGTNLSQDFFSSTRVRVACCGPGRAAIDQYLLPAETTAANPSHTVAADEWDRQTDR